MRGPKPKPTALKELEGNRGKRARPKREPKPKLAIPQCPEFMGPSEKKEWARITKELHALGLLTEIDRGALVAYVSAWSEVENATRQLKKGYEVEAIATTTGRPYKKLSPWVRILKDARKQMLEALREFGMSPSSRTRVTPADGQETEKQEPAAGKLVAFEGGKR